MDNSAHALWLSDLELLQLFLHSSFVQAKHFTQLPQVRLGHHFLTACFFFWHPIQSEIAPVNTTSCWLLWSATLLQPTRDPTSINQVSTLSHVFCKTASRMVKVHDLQTYSGEVLLNQLSPGCRQQQTMIINMSTKTLQAISGQLHNATDYACNWVSQRHRIKLFRNNHPDVCACIPQFTCSPHNYTTTQSSPTDISSCIHRWSPALPVVRHISLTSCIIMNL